MAGGKRAGRSSAVADEGAQHSVAAYRNGALAGQGTGANVLGEPHSALAWVANELCTYGDGLRAGDSVKADFGKLGVLEVGFA